jgi:hypothetical protein
VAVGFAGQDSGIHHGEVEADGSLAPIFIQQNVMVLDVMTANARRPRREPTAWG